MNEKENSLIILIVVVVGGRCEAAALAAAPDHLGRRTRHETIGRLKLAFSSSYWDPEGYSLMEVVVALLMLLASPLMMMVKLQLLPRLADSLVSLIRSPSSTDTAP